MDSQPVTNANLLEMIRTLEIEMMEMEEKLSKAGNIFSIHNKTRELERKFDYLAKWVSENFTPVKEGLSLAIDIQRAEIKALSADNSQLRREMRSFFRWAVFHGYNAVTDELTPEDGTQASMTHLHRTTVYRPDSFDPSQDESE